MIKSASYLLTQAMRNISGMELEKQRLMRNLIERGKHHKLNNTQAANDCLKAAKMVYTLMINPTPLDHQIMAQSFALLASVHKTASPSQSNAYYQMANHFLNNLPPSEFEQIKNLPIITFIRNKENVAVARPTASVRQIFL